MYLVTGGAFQGKLDYALGQTKLTRECFIDGKTADQEDIFHAEGIFDFHLYVKRFLTSCGQKELEAFAQRLHEENPGLVIITDEIGCGVVPLDKEDRRCRECTGRVCTALAERAERVDRVVCGIGQVLKGGQK